MLVSRLSRRRRGYSYFGGWGNCCCTGPIAVDTKWCGLTACVAPGTITVTIKSGTCPGGATVATATAGTDGVAHFPALAAGTYCASASTTSSGFSNSTTTFTYSGSGIANLVTALYPSQLTITDSALGTSVTAFPSGPAPPGSSAGPSSYWGSTSFSVPATGCCPAAAVTLWYGFFCTYPACSSNPAIVLEVTSSNSGTGGYPCPDPAGTITTSGTLAICPTTGVICYPTNLSGTHTFTCPGTGAAGDLYGVVCKTGAGICLGTGTVTSPSGVSTTFTCTQ